MKKPLLVAALLLLVIPVQAKETDLVQYVNTMQGTSNTYEFSHGRCRPSLGKISLQTRVTRVNTKNKLQ